MATFSTGLSSTWLQSPLHEYSKWPCGPPGAVGAGVPIVGALIVGLLGLFIGGLLLGSVVGLLGFPGVGNACPPGTGCVGVALPGVFEIPEGVVPLAG